MDTPRLFYFCPDTQDKRGGIKILYRHVDILCAHGMDAYIVHTQKEFRCVWFENNTPIQYVADIEFRSSDCIVISEFWLPRMLTYKYTIKDFFRGYVNRKRDKHVVMDLAKLPIKKIIFNQGCYLTFDGLGIDKDPHHLLYRDAVAIVVVSEDSKKYMQYAFPNQPVFRIHNSLQTHIFSYSAEKKKQICFLTKKAPQDVEQVINLLKLRGRLDGFQFVPIDNKTEQEVASVMKESLLFLSFGYAEGCPLTPAEAMACGCVVVGYDGRGGSEYFDSIFCYPIEVGDVIGFARQVEFVIEGWKNNPDSLIAKGKQASEFIRSVYSSDVEKQDVVNAWTHILKI